MGKDLQVGIVFLALMGLVFGLLAVYWISQGPTAPPRLNLSEQPAAPSDKAGQPKLLRPEPLTEQAEVHSPWATHRETSAIHELAPSSHNDPEQPIDTGAAPTAGRIRFPQHETLLPAN